MTVLRGAHSVLRPYTHADIAALREAADDAAVARWMSHRFPHPYRLAHAEDWIELNLCEPAPVSWVIEVAGRLAGGIGFSEHGGERAGVAEFGYWLARPFWSRGIATDAAAVLCAYAFEERGIRRLEAHVFAANRASARVLEKVGFIREAIMRAALVERDGAPSDAWLYAKLHPEPFRGEPAWQNKTQPSR